MKVDNPYLTPTKGMTIFKAFLLVFLCVSLIHIIGWFSETGFLYGLIQASVNNTAKIIFKPNSYGQLISYVVFIFIGWKINKYEIPLFSKSKFSDYLKVLILGVLWIVFCIFLNDMVTTKNIGTVAVNQDFKEYFNFTGSLRNVNSILYALFYLGVLGHGLLKNYKFKEIIVILAFFSLPVLHPTVVLQYLFLNLILIYIYYHTLAFQLILFFLVIAAIIDHVFVLLYSPHELRYENIIKDQIIGNEIAYYLFMSIVIVSFLYILFSFKNPEKLKHCLTKNI
jgi:hypothetical protein